MGQIHVHENATVWATTKEGVMLPRAFILNGTRLEVASIDRTWTGWHGTTKYHYWQVVADERTFVLCFNVASLEWMVKEGPAG